MDRLRFIVEVILLRAYALGAMVIIRLWQHRAIVLGITCLVLAAASCWAWQVKEINSPPVANSPESTAPATYTYYFPLVIGAPNKRGAISATCAEQSQLGATWTYNYSTSDNGCDEYVPMIWGESFVDYPVAQSEWLLGFNEPDLSNQANLTPERAAELWRKLESKYPGKKLVSPATLTGLRATDWLTRFYQVYQDRYGIPPRLDAIAFHWYGWDAQNAIDSTQRIIDLALRWNVQEVWLTEFAFLQDANEYAESCWGHSFADEQIEAQKFLSWLDGETMITRYAWFAPRIDTASWYALQPSQCNSPLFDYESGALTRWGELYRYPSIDP